MPLFANLRYPSRPISSRTTTSTADILQRAAALFRSNIVLFLFVSAVLHQGRSIVDGAVDKCSQIDDYAKPHRSFVATYNHTSHTSPVKPIGNHTAPVKPIGNSTSPAKPAGNSTSPVKPLGNSTSPVKPVESPNSPVKPVESPNSPLKPVAYHTPPLKPVRRSLIAEWDPLASDPHHLFGVAWRISALHTFGSIIIYPALYGIVSIKVVEDVMGQNRPFGWGNWFLDGHRGLLIALHRLFSKKFATEWAIRSLVAQVLGLYLFSSVADFKSFLKLLLLYNFTSMFEMKTWVSALFELLWSLIDIMGFVGFALDSWSLILGERWVIHGLLGVREFKLKEGFSALGALFCPSFMLIKLLEVLICGSLGKLILKAVFVKGFVILVQSLMAVYFKVAMLLCFYAAARQHKPTTSAGMCRV